MFKNHFKEILLKLPKIALSIALAALCLAGCDSGKEQKNAIAPTESKTGEKKVLVAYFSIYGNTQKIAERVQQELGADLLRIETVKEYPNNPERYKELTEIGKEEVDNEILPELKPIDKNLKEYDVVIVGTPTWWSTAAPAVMSFLKSFNLSGKTMCFFATHGSGPGSVITDMQKACNGANPGPSLEIEFAFPANGQVLTSEDTINAWINELKTLIGKN